MFESRLKALRTQKGLNMKQTAQLLNIPYTTYVGYEKNEREPNSEVLIQLADFFDCTIDYLLGKSGEIKPASDDSIFDRFDNVKPIKLKRFPMLGEIACGEPIWADEDKESYVMADMDIGADFCLTAKGDSMINARINDGDIVFIKEMPIVENGEIAAVIIDNEATLKRFYYDRESNFLQLVAENPKYSPLVYRDEQLDTIRVLGKAVYFMSAVE